MHFKCPTSKSPDWLKITTTVALTVCVLYASTVRLNGVDFWLQAKVGELIAASGNIPQTILFPFTEISTEKFNAHEWLSSLLFHYALSFLGEDNIPFLIGLLGLVLFSIMARLSYIRSNGNYPIALLGGFISVLVENYRHVLRPELPSLILLALLLIQLENIKSKPNIIGHAGSALIIALWANSHGSFILGPIVVAIYCIGSYIDLILANNFDSLRPNKLVINFFQLTIVSCIACFFTPFGFELIQFVFSFGTHSESSKHLTEWMPTFDPRMHVLRGFWIALGTWILSVLIILFNYRRVSAVDLLMFLAFSYLAFSAIRFPVYLGIISALPISRHMSTYFQTPKKTKYFMLSLTFINLALLGLIYKFGNAANLTTYTELDTTKFSIPMVETLKNPELQGNVLNTMELGAELVYLTYPRMRPSIDCRIDSYGFCLLYTSDAADD